MNYIEEKLEKTHTVCIVEDEWIVSMELQEHLRNMGFDIVGPFDEGVKALNSFNQLRPDLVLMDIKIKGEIDGIETTEKINKKYKVPVVYVTANTDETTLKRALNTNPFGVINKPYDVNELKKTIDTVLKKSGYAEEMGDCFYFLQKAALRFQFAMIVYNSFGEIVLLNRKACQITGWNEFDVIGINVDKIYTTYEDKNCVERRVCFQYKSNVNSFNRKAYLKTKNGVVKRIFESTINISEECTTSVYSIIVFDEKALQNSEIQYFKELLKM